MSAAQETPYTACRRRDDSDVLPPQALRDIMAAAQPWTATRCHRLLRPLLSHLAALRKEEARIAAKKGDGAGQRPALQAERTADTSRQSPSSEYAAGSKRVRYTYSLKGPRRRHQQQHAASSKAAVQAMSDATKANKSKSSPVPSAQHRQQLAGRYVSPGEVVVPTPVLCRATKQKRAFSLPSSPIASHMCMKIVEEKGAEPASPSTEAARSRCSVSVYRGYCSSASLHGGNAGSGPDSAIRDDWARLSSATPGKRFQLYESIFRAVEALLRATSSAGSRGPKRETTKKPRSLLEMCLRKVPRYVVACEDAERQEALQCGQTPPASSQISFEVYNDLESLGHGADGWQHLRTVVRAHAIGLVTVACAEGLLHFAFIRILIRLLTLSSADAEAESLLAASVWRSATYPMPTEGADSVFSTAPGPSEALRTFVEYAEESGRWSCLFQQLDGLLQSGRLSPAWLSTRAFGGIWERVIRTSSSSGASTGEGRFSLNFAEAAIIRLIHCLPDDNLEAAPSRLRHSAKSRSSLQHSLLMSSPSPSPSQPSSSSSSSSFHTLASVIGSLAAVVILQQEAVSGTVNCRTGKTVPSLRRLASIVETCLASDPEAKKSRRKSRSLDSQMSETKKRFLIGLARFLSSFGGNADGTEAKAASWCEEIALRSGPEQRRQLYDATVTLVASVAHSCGRGAAATADAKAARVYLVQLCSYVTGRLGSCFWQPGARDDTARRMQADGAFLLASRTNDLRDLALAESLSDVKVQGRAQRLELYESLLLVSSATRSEAAISERPSDQHQQQHQQQQNSAARTALFAGYRWEEGISEWVIASPKPKEPRASDLDRDKRTLVTRSRSLSLVSLGTVSAVAHHGRDEIGHVTPHQTPSPVMTTPEKAAGASLGAGAGTVRHCSAAAPEENLCRSKRLRPGRSSWPGRRPRLDSPDEPWSILSLVSEDEDDTDAEQDGFDEISLLERKRLPLLRVDGNTSGLPGLGKRKRALARTGLRIDDDASDDELCL